MGTTDQATRLQIAQISDCTAICNLLNTYVQMTSEGYQSPSMLRRSISCIHMQLA
jgi:hypothetical protein